jgi:hypothetical protein
MNGLLNILPIIEGLLPITIFGLILCSLWEIIMWIRRKKAKNENE